jgi:hypothetical protein
MMVMMGYAPQLHSIGKGALVTASFSHKHAFVWVDHMAVAVRSLALLKH